jgi:hypothetical protein
VNWWKRGALGTMTDESAKKARLMRVMDEMTMELQRQGVAEVLQSQLRPKGVGRGYDQGGGWRGCAIPDRPVGPVSTNRSARGLG